MTLSEARAARISSRGGGQDQGGGVVQELGQHAAGAEGQGRSPVSSRVTPIRSSATAPSTISSARRPSACGGMRSAAARRASGVGEAEGDGAGLALVGDAEGLQGERVAEAGGRGGDQRVGVGGGDGGGHGQAEGGEGGLGLRLGQRAGAGGGRRRRWPGAGPGGGRAAPARIAASMAATPSAMPCSGVTPPAAKRRRGRLVEVLGERGEHRGARAGGGAGGDDRLDGAAW